MKTKYYLLAFGMTALFTACQNENEPSLPADQPGKNGAFRIVIEGENTEPATRGTITFPGGSASGAGLYDGNAKTVVSATPDPGYEINYFYGGPDTEPRKYDITNNGGVSTFDVGINGQDHTFHVGFQRKTGTLNIIAGTGGSVSPSGQQTYNQEEPVNITATANDGYVFTGWSVSGDVSVDNPSSNNAKATLHGSSGTVTANFKQNALIQINLNVSTRIESGGIGERNFITYSSNANLSIKYNFESTVRRDDGSSDTNYWSSTYSSGQEIENYYYYNDGYGNEDRTRGTLESITITYNGEVVYTGSTLPSDGYTSGKYIIKR